MQVIFAVTDLERSLDFYERAFGWPRNDRIDYSDYVELLTPDGAALGLVERAGFAGLVGSEPAEVPDGRVAPAYVYVRVDEIEQAIARIEDAGGRALSPLAVHSWGERAAWFADPDGNAVAIASPVT